MTITTVPPTSADPLVEVKGYSTDPKFVGYQILTNYESTYWRPLVGADAWTMYEVLRSFCHQGENTCHPSINLLMAILGIKQRWVLIGGTTKVKGKAYHYPGLIELLQQHKLVIAEGVGEGPMLRYVFHVQLTPGLLTADQISQLPAVLQRKHVELMERCQQRQSELEAKRRPPKIPATASKSLVTSPSAGVSQIVRGGLTNCERGSHNLLVEQQPENNTQLTTDRAREKINNSGETSTTSDVVVAFSASKVANDETPPASIPENIKEDVQTISLTRGTFTIEPVHELTLTQPGSSTPTPLDPLAPAGTAPRSDAAVALIALGLADTVAKRLTSRYNAERIQEKIEFLAYLQEYAPEKVKNPRGWLRRAIEEDYGPPDGFLTTAEREQLAADEERQGQVAVARWQAQQAREAEQAVQTHVWRQRLHEQYGTTAEDLAFWEKAQAEIKFASISHPDLKTLLASAEILRYIDTTVQIGIAQEASFRQLGHPGTRKVLQRVLTQAAGRTVEPEFVLLTKPREADW